MSHAFDFKGDFRRNAVSPLLEMGAYEALWLEEGASFKRIADKFRSVPNGLPSDFVDIEHAEGCARQAFQRITQAGVSNFGIRVHGAGGYPSKLRDARHPIELLYYMGWWDLVDRPAVAVVGSRKATDDGLKRARKVARLLCDNGVTVVSGLASGIDSAAHSAAIENNGYTIAVIGTPISHTYPRENVALQRELAERFLVISQIPVLRYDRGNPTVNRFFFPERNVTMSALTRATIIVEASDTSGTLIQARAALHQGRKLLILNSCFERGLNWPEKFLAKGAIRIRSDEELAEALFGDDEADSN